MSELRPNRERKVAKSDWLCIGYAEYLTIRGGSRREQVFGSKSVGVCDVVDVGEVVEVVGGADLVGGFVFGDAGVQAGDEVVVAAADGYGGAEDADGEAGALSGEDEMFCSGLWRLRRLLVRLRLDVVDGWRKRSAMQKDNQSRNSPWTRHTSDCSVGWAAAR